MSTSSIRYNQSFSHVDEFLGLRCAPELLEARLFPNGKEVTESMSAYVAVRKHVHRLCGFEFGQDDVNVLVVGDGHQPRTGALFAMRSKWSVTSVDPLLRCGSTLGEVNLNGIKILRLSTFRSRIEELSLDYRGRKLIIISVHSHAKNSDVVAGIKFDTAHVVSIPCCVFQPPVSDSFVEFEDQSLWSPKNKVVVSFDSTPEHKGWKQ
jgi:hypothetical protein